MKKLFLLSFVLIILISCSTKKKEYRITPENEGFLSTVRYIFIEEEKDMYNEYPPAEREEFIEKFWARRDPTPYTVRNEFKDHYFQRIRDANNLFRTGGIAGWLQDRGRIYILFGPPDERIINPGGRPMDPFAQAQEMDPVSTSTARTSVGAGEQPSETWIYYELLATSQVVRIIFVDKHATGNYALLTNIDQLASGYLETLVNPRLSLIHELAKQESQIKQQQEQQARKILFNFQWDFKKEKDRDKDSNLNITIKIPYERILFLREQETTNAGLANDRYIADIKLFIEIKDADQSFIWDYNKNYSLRFNPHQLNSFKKSKWILSVPVTRQLKKGKYSVYIHLMNVSADQDVKKLLKLKM